MRYSVLTYIFNRYDWLREVQQPDPEAEYICVTDDRNLRSNTWKLVYDDKLDGLSPFDKCYEVRFHPFRYVNSDICLRVDGSVLCKQSPAPVIDKFEEGRYDRCLMIHPARNRMEPEYDIWCRCRRYPRQQADRCLEMMRQLGYDMNYRGLYQGCFEILRNNEINTEINTLTFDFLLDLGTEDGRIERLDQTITSFVINRMFADKLHVLPVSESMVTRSPYFQWYIHRSDRPIADAKKIPPYLFNEPCEPWRGW